MSLNKLVRDGIPGLIERENKVPVTRILPDDEYKSELYKKLREEVEEYLLDENTEELADVLEVVYAIAELQGISVETLEKMRKDKQQVRGGFKDRVFLEKVLE